MTKRGGLGQPCCHRSVFLGPKSPFSKVPLFFCSFSLVGGGLGPALLSPEHFLGAKASIFFSSKVLCTVFLRVCCIVSGTEEGHSKYTRTLTFENLCQIAMVALGGKHSGALSFFFLNKFVAYVALGGKHSGALSSKALSM